MSDHAIKRPEEEYIDPSHVFKLRVLFIILAVVGVIGSLYGLYLGNVKHFAYGWLYGFYFVFSICAGCLFWTMLHHAVDANWTVVVRRIPETFITLFFPWLLYCFAPILVFMPLLYKWINTPEGADPLLDWKSGYLNEPFLYTRIGIYFLIFGFFGSVLHFLSTRQDPQGALGYTLLSRKLSYPGIFLVGVSLTFMAFDLLMALDHHWFSTMWGVYIFAGCAGSSMATIILISNALRSSGYYKGVITQEHNHIMGKLLFAFTVFWAYISFSQYMLIYYANIPEETIFFKIRNTGTWGVVSAVLVFGRFFIPFFLLLTQPAKRDARRLCFASAWIIVFHALDYYWIIMPAKSKAMGTLAAGFSPVMMDFLPLIGMVGVVGFLFVNKFSQHSILPVRDPRLYESMTLTN